MSMRFREHRTVRFVRTHISVIAFAVGFVWDTITLNRIDSLYDQAVLAFYMLVVPASIILLHAVETRRLKSAWLVARRRWLPALVAFPIGGLFSAFIIFYSKSASLWTSWPFLLLLVVMFIGNEFVHKRYERLVFQVGMFYFVLFTYCALVVPTVLGTIGTATFVLAGLMSLFVVALFLQLVMRLFPDVYRRSLRGLWLAVGGIYIGMHVLYVTNIIPPVPLSLKEIGIYHSVVRTEGAYQVSHEPLPWHAELGLTRPMFHRTPGAAAYCFSSVYAPTRLSANIYHGWYKRAADGSWTRDTRIPFAIRGGRLEGYRGYTVKTALAAGDWRCQVETERGQVLGIQSFVVEDVSVPPALVEGVR